MPAMAGKPVGFMATEPLEAFLAVTMPLPFRTRMKAPEASVDRILGKAAGTGSATAGSVASANEDNTIKARRTRFVMFAPADATAITVKETRCQ